MKCNDLRLFEYLEGISSAKEKKEIEDHLKLCKVCRENFDQLKFTVDVLTDCYTHQIKSSCPTSEELVSLVDNELEEERKKQIIIHAELCPSCQKEIKLLKDFEEEFKTIDFSMEPPTLSVKVLSGIEKLKRESEKEKLKSVLKKLITKGKEKISKGRINEFLDEYLTLKPVSDFAPVLAFPPDDTLSESDLELREIETLTDFTFELGDYKIDAKLVEAKLTMRISFKKKFLKDVEVIVKSESCGERKCVTDCDGKCEIDGLLIGPFHLKVSVPKKKIK
ncbi:hypothetical protein KKB18_04495 [bacterium]|nr:hypothetical protein [bacterium]